VIVSGRTIVLLLSLVLLTACRSDSRPEPSAPSAGPRPWILLVTLDTTRADAIGPDAKGTDTPAFNALAARGRRFAQAYATAPETLPSHASMMTGLYPAGHGIHENARFLAATHAVAAERLQQAGYRTAAFVSSFVLARRFGLARGFDVYDDELAREAVERSAADTTERALARLSAASSPPQFVWVHYFDPHAPYAPAGPFRERFRDRPYHGEVAAMDEQLGRLVRGFEAAASRHGAPAAVVVAGDHGEGLGDHGERTHGNLLYQSTMHVPMIVVGPAVAAGVVRTAVSTRRVFHTLLDFAGVQSADSLRGDSPEVVLGEAMKPFLSYGWQPQIMAVSGPLKSIFAGSTETYDLPKDPGESKNLGSGASLPAGMRKALDDYPVPSPDAARATETLSEEARRNLASLGYVSGGSVPVVRKDAPRPADMVALFDTIERASTLFVNARYREVIPLLQSILVKDPNNLDATLRLATAYSMLGQNTQAMSAFRKAAAIAPKSDDVRLYLALHQARGPDWHNAVPTLERLVRDTPDRLAAVEGLALIRERENRLAAAIELRQRVYALRTPSAAELVALGEMAMEAGQTAAAIEAFEKGRVLQGAAFKHDLELGVLYLDARRLPEARDALERVGPSHPAYPMALFKRAQVSVLLNEPDASARIARARANADATTRPLIAREKLFTAK
jgi:arylsulfatase A-like enzyme/Tfp pilus assembly protein PilF